MWEDMKNRLVAASAPLHADVVQIAVDAGVSPPLVWVANGSGPGRLLQLAGSDLSLNADWGDNGETLSFPRQSGNQPILNAERGQDSFRSPGERRRTP
jgi:hypothetical protein